MFMFVHGTLRKGYGLNHVLKSSTYLGEATLVAPSAVLVLLSRHSYPSVVPIPSHIVAVAGIDAPTGEVYQISDSILQRLDAIEGVPAYYQRVNGEVLPSDDMQKRIKAEGMRAREYYSTFYYGMRRQSPYLDNALLVNNGDFTNPTIGDKFREWEARVFTDISTNAPPPLPRFRRPPTAADVRERMRVAPADDVVDVDIDAEF